MNTEIFSKQLAAMLCVVSIFCLGVPNVEAWENNIDRPGQDFSSFWISKEIEMFTAPGKCESACRNNQKCMSFTYVKPGIQGEDARCYLKSGVPTATQNNCCVSGIVRPVSISDRCNLYADTATMQAKLNNENECQYSGGRWTTNRADHYNWCVQVPDQNAIFEENERKRLLKECIPSEIVVLSELKIKFPRSIFVGNQIEKSLDRDHDGLIDNMENALANIYKPYFIFDDAEAARKPHEPITVFQVRSDDVTAKVGNNYVNFIKIRFVFLFSKDHYGPEAGTGCNWGSGSHKGDAEDVVYTLSSKDQGVIWRLEKIELANWKPGPTWSYGGEQLNLKNKTHPMIYLSASKHHLYFNTTNDHEGSIYSDPPLFFARCDDDVNGKGEKFLADIKSLADNTIYKFNNVGEKNAHDPQYFVNDLSKYFDQNLSLWGNEMFYEVTILANGWLE